MKKSLLITILTIIAAVALGPLGVVCLAAIPELSPEELFQSATHVLRGKVIRVYSSVESASGNWQVTRCVVELQVDQVEKGKSPGRLTYIRFQSRRYTGSGDPPPGHYGQQPPQIGSQLRVFALQANDGGLDALSPNGFRTEGKE